MQPSNGSNPFGPTQNPFGPTQNPFNPTAQNPFQGAANQPATPPKKRSKLWLLLAGVPITATAACCIAYQIDSRGHENASVLEDVCAGQRSARSAPYLPSALPHRLVWMEHRGSDWSHRGGPPVPSGWSTLWADEAQLVVCAEEAVPQVIERCPFDNGRTIERRQLQQGIRLVVPSTGQVLTQQVLMGAMPRVCNATEAFSRRSGPVTQITGEAPPESAIQAMLEPFVTR